MEDEKSKEEQPKEEQPKEEEQKEEQQKEEQPKEEQTKEEKPEEEKPNWRELMKDDKNFSQEVPFDFKKVSEKLKKASETPDKLNPYYTISAIFDFTKFFKEISSALSMGFSDIK